jgi:hypothetical protein
VKMRYFIFVLSLVILLMAANSPLSRAQTPQEPAGFKNVTLWLYPEYDDPRLLMMLEGKIMGAQVPAQIRFLVPVSAELYSAGSKDAQGKYTGGPPNRIASQIPGWDEISYELKYETFRVEYYDSIITGNPDKKISYDFRHLYPISDLTVIVQQPLTANNFTVTPAGRPDKEDAFKVSTYNFNNPAISQPLHFEIAYVKTDPNPSLNTAPASSNSAGQVTLIITLAIVVIAIGVFIVLGQSRKKKPVRAKTSETRSRSVGKREPLRDKFCNQCGNPRGKRDKFCPNCGNPTDPSELKQ